MGRSRGGLTTKVHVVTDGLGNPLRFLLSSGNRNDICLAREILEPFALTGKLILADKGYDSDKFVHWIKERGGIPIIPSRNSARQPRETDWHTYKERQAVFKIFCKCAKRGTQRISRARGLRLRACANAATASAAWPWQVAGEMLKWGTDGRPMKVLRACSTISVKEVRSMIE